MNSEREMLKKAAVRHFSGLLIIEDAFITVPPTVVSIKGYIRVSVTRFEDPNQFSLFIRDASRVYVDLLDIIEQCPLQLEDCPTFEITGELDMLTNKPVLYRANVSLSLYLP